ASPRPFTSSCRSTRVPPSCPTRRSSDLRIPDRPPLRDLRLARSLSSRRTRDRLGRRSRRSSPTRFDTTPTHELMKIAALVAGIRSEEHTSELQSRENLVCRLLLEKKKKT